MHEHSLLEFSSESLYFAFLKLDCAVGECKEGVIGAALHIPTGMVFCPTLTDEYISLMCGLSAINLNAEAL